MCLCYCETFCGNDDMHFYYFDVCKWKDDPFFHWSFLYIMFVACLLMFGVYSVWNGWCSLQNERNMNKIIEFHYLMTSVFYVGYDLPSTRSRPLQGLPLLGHDGKYQPVPITHCLWHEFNRPIRSEIQITRSQCTKFGQSKWVPCTNLHSDNRLSPHQATYSTNCNYESCIASRNLLSNIS